MDTERDSSVALRNGDVEHLVNAAAKYGVYGLGRMLQKRFALLVMADIHRCAGALRRATSYLDMMDALDAGICLGDMQGSNFAENDGAWYLDVIRGTTKRFFTVIGNHDGGQGNDRDVCGTKQQVFDKFIKPVREQMQLPKLSKTYYCVNFDQYKITMIVLDNYDVPDDSDEHHFLINRETEMISQEQADWLQSVLMNVPKDYHVIVARHSITEACVPIESDWTQSEFQIQDVEHGCVTGNLVTDLIDAWIHGKSIHRKYCSEEFSQIPPVVLDVDYSKRGQGNFVAYLVGHSHVDWHGVCEKYPEQNVIIFPSSADDDWQNLYSDLPRLLGTKAQDCFTVFTVDTQERMICLVRVGSNITYRMVERTATTIKY